MFSPDGNLLLVPTQAGIRIMDVQTGVLQTFLDSGDVMAFADNGRRVLSGTSGAVHVWNIDPILFASANEQVRLACAGLRRISSTRYSDRERRLFPMLQQSDPCANVR